jgi:hypothetical protein
MVLGAALCMVTAMVHGAGNASFDMSGLKGASRVAVENGISGSEEFSGVTVSAGNTERNIINGSTNINGSTEITDNEDRNGNTDIGKSTEVTGATDSTVSLNSFETIVLLNPWLGTSNPAGLHFNEGPLPGRMNLHYGLQDGAYKRVQQGDRLDRFSLQSSSYTRVKDMNLFGSFSYEKSLEQGLDFSNTNDPYRGTPYDMIDTVGGDSYNREFFFLNGTLAKPLGRSLVAGVSYDFGVGVSVQDRDPRPQNKVLDMSLKPGLIWSLPKLKLGLNLEYVYYNEEIDIDIIKENAYMTIFRVLGPAVAYTHEAKSFNRLYKRNSRGGGGQLNYRNGRLDILLSGEFLYFNESAHDGGKGGDASWSYLRHVSDLEGMDWSADGTLKYSGDRFMHLLNARLNVVSSLGTEKIAKLVQVGVLDTQDWIFFMDDPKYCSEKVDARVTYDWVRMKGPFTKDWSVRLGGGYSSFAERYHIPFQEQWYSSALVSLEAEKIFHAGRSAFTLGGGVRYRWNLDGLLDLEISNFMYDKLLQPDYMYLTDDYVVPSVRVAYELPLKRIFEKYFFDSRVELYRGTEGRSRLMAGFSTGVIF